MAVAGKAIIEYLLPDELQIRWSGAGQLILSKRLASY
jgi:hypothetical protein